MVPWLYCVSEGRAVSFDFEPIRADQWYCEFDTRITVCPKSGSVFGGYSYREGAV